METQNKLYYYHNDINGAPLRLTDEAGNIVWNAHYDIFGKIDKISKNEIDNPIRMQGQYEDEETGLYYNRYRYYDPVISAYVSQDPLGLGAGENVYSYVKNSFGWIDPLGLVGNPATATHITYEGIDKATGKPYIGYASMQGNQTGTKVIDYRYNNDFNRFEQKPEVIYRGEGTEGKATARGLEQRHFEKNDGLEGTANKQNPVGKNNKNRSKYLESADKHLEEQQSKVKKTGCGG